MYALIPAHQGQHLQSPPVACTRCLLYPSSRSSSATIMQCQRTTEEGGVQGGLGPSGQAGVSGYRLHSLTRSLSTSYIVAFNIHVACPLVNADSRRQFLHSDHGMARTTIRLFLHRTSFSLIITSAESPNFQAHNSHAGIFCRSVHSDTGTTSEYFCTGGAFVDKLKRTTLSGGSPFVLAIGTRVLRDVDHQHADYIMDHRDTGGQISPHAATSLWSRF
ncbi:hypothetical protein C8R43DRAFT_976530 [Mycena crocata]|nr:hypothetical protein C8R43DRAFT_976530 [Mycena crocata]